MVKNLTKPFMPTHIDAIKCPGKVNMQAKNFLHILAFSSFILILLTILTVLLPYPLTSSFIQILYQDTN